MKKGLIVLHTGNGKGKTTAALGIILRSVGHNLKVCMVQFIKGNWKTGEIEALKSFENKVKVYVSGKGFTWESKNIEEDIEAAQDAWNLAKTVIDSGKYNLVVLDELTYLIKYNFVKEEDILDALNNKPKDLHIVITGRNASEKLIEVADLVSEVNVLKHPYKEGIKAQKGIEF
ncbi:MAG: cob(I)yrinic acid a,c-diamide adenosyltransferase [Nitrospinae bacterium]|nr:cob(I)yrinic acid a,c-diamide adenosyltransferase [Nitrospinota bacterium]